MSGGVLDANEFKRYVDRFNADDVEDVVNLIPNAGAWDWISSNAPLFECPDRAIEEIYYYRWWTYRKHIKQTPAGRVVTEFILPVKHAGAYNTVSCALGHHIAEGRWLRDQRFLDEYITFWFRGDNGKPQPHFHKYSQWTAAALRSRCAVTGDLSLALELLDDLVADYHAWEIEKRLSSGMFWQHDVWDGMEESISGSRKQRNVRPTINSYMFANARAISAFALLARRDELATTFVARAGELQQLVQRHLWDPQARFFKVMFENGPLSDAREAIGFVPWCFGLPQLPEMEDAWRQLVDPEGFWAPCGLTTAERRHPRFRSHGVGHCEWDGAVWPFATSQTLNALANQIRYGNTDVVSPRHYFEAVQVYARSHHKDGKRYIGEYLDERTGEWLKADNPRSRYYNHSTFCDLVISGLVGVQPRFDGVVISPLVPEQDAWDWFCLDEVPYRARTLTIIWDRTGERYRRGAGLHLLADGETVAYALTLQPIFWKIT
jgi:hypothetical protein